MNGTVVAYDVSALDDRSEGFTVCVDCAEDPDAEHYHELYARHVATITCYVCGTVIERDGATEDLFGPPVELSNQDDAP